MLGFMYVMVIYVFFYCYRLGFFCISLGIIWIILFLFLVCFWSLIWLLGGCLSMVKDNVVYFFRRDVFFYCVGGFCFFID